LLIESISVSNSLNNQHAVQLLAFLQMLIVAAQVYSTRAPPAQYRYTNQNAQCAFIELDHCMARDTFVRRLASLYEVGDVRNCTHKFDLSIPGNADNVRGTDYGLRCHYLQQDVLVKPKTSKHYIAFTLTRSGHKLSRSGQDTCSAAFKTPKNEKGLLLTAWCILMKVAGDNTLFPAKVEEWYADILAKHGDSQVRRLLEPVATSAASGAAVADPFAAASAASASAVADPAAAANSASVIVAAVLPAAACASFTITVADPATAALTAALIGPVATMLLAIVEIGPIIAIMTQMTARGWILGILTNRLRQAQSNLKLLSRKVHILAHLERHTQSKLEQTLSCQGACVVKPLSGTKR
jgi:hypothetical protein